MLTFLRCFLPRIDSMSSNQFLFWFLLHTRNQKANNLTSTWIFYTCLCFLFQLLWRKVVGKNAPRVLFMRRAPHWSSRCLISAVPRYFPTSKSLSLFPLLQLSRSINCSTLCRLGLVWGYGDSFSSSKATSDWFQMRRIFVIATIFDT